MIAALTLSAGCVGSGKIASTSALEPFPSEIRLLSETTAGCREGESGFDYRFLVVGPTDLSSSSALAQHIRARGFTRTDLDINDLPWVTVAYQQLEDRGVRAEAGPLDRYLARLTPHTGPPIEALSQDVRDHASQYVILALRPTDFLCTTPL